jgi:hypothetical protein
MLSRRDVVRNSLCLGVAGAVAPSLVFPARAHHAVNRNFTVLRDGNQIGTHSITMSQNGDEKIVDVEVALAVKIAFITVFRLEHRNRETWRAGRLLKIDTKTNDNGKDFKVDGNANATGFDLVVNGERTAIPKPIIPTSYWNPATVDQDLLLNSVNGKLLKVGIKPTLSESVKTWTGPVSADKYEMRGDLDIDLWYDAGKHIVRLAFESKGSVIAYDLTSGTT